MATYCYIDLDTGERFTSEQYGLEETENVRRDYKSENAGFFIPSHMSSKNTSSWGDFLPSAKDFESPTDPDGAKGIEQWNETHQPAPGNKSPRRPKGPAGSKKVFALS